jgi:PAS domain S-box-containing protein
MGVVELTGDDILHISSNAATARFFGVRPGDLDGQLASRLGAPPDILGLWAERYREAERTGAPVRFEYAHEAPQGKTWLSATVGFIGRTPAGRPQFSFIVEDITERRRAEEQLRDQAGRLKEADRRKDEFLAMLAHELRNPLAALSNAVQLSRRTELREGLGLAQDVMERQVKHLARLIDDLLDVSRISQGKIRLRKESVEIAATVARAVETVRPLVEERGHDLTVALDAGPLRVEGDPTRLEQVLVNLLTNAAKYTEDGGRIAVAARRDGEDVVVTVRDSGVGIAPEMLPRIFEIFTQVDESLDRSQGGLGLGLTLVQKLVEMHGGVVTAASGGRGHGSEFTLRLPASSGTPSAVPEAREPDAPARASRILVVDDNVDTAQLCARILGLAGHDVHTVHDGPAAVAAAREFRPEVVLLDIGLPGFDGYQVARRIRQEPSCARVVLIAVSGYGQEEDRRRALAAGFDRHLIKPVDVDALLALLARSGVQPPG